MELIGDQLKIAESRLKEFLPQSQLMYGCLLLGNRSDRTKTDLGSILVDRWPEFSVIIYKPHRDQECKGDLFKDILIFATDTAALQETIRNPSVIDWTRFLCVGINFLQMEILNAVASEKGVPSHRLAVCRSLTLEDVCRLPLVDSSGISLGSMDESHIPLLNEKWKFGEGEDSVRMIHDMVSNFPSCCVLDKEGRPVSWILTYRNCAIGMLYTLPEHRGKGYAKVVISTMAKRLHAEGYPVYCFIEEENQVSYGLFKGLGFTEQDPSYRIAWFGYNNL